MVLSRISLFLTFALTLFSVASVFSQDLYPNQLSSIEKTVEGINTSDYKLMKKQWGLLGRLIIPKKMLRKEFQPMVEAHGPFSIDTVLFGSRYSATAELKSSIHPEKRTFLKFIFNDNGKLEGLGQGYPTFVYKRKTSNEGNQANKDLEERIDTIVESYIHRKSPHGFNGSILVTEGESILYKKSTGRLNFRDDKMVNDSSLFLLASCSKQFTAVAIMKLTEVGLIDFDHLVKDYLPAFPYDNITIRHLLVHASGLPAYFTLLDKHWDKSKYATNSDVLNIFAEQKPELLFNPNERFSYSNTGYIMLSLIIESVSGKSYGDYLKTIVFEPLAMENTVVYHRRISGDTLQNYAIGNVYSRAQKKYILPDSSSNHKYVSYMDGLTGDDGISSTILDLKKWNEGLRSHTMLSKEMTERGRVSHVLSNGKETGYGFGIFVKRGQGIQNIEYHTGGWPGYSTMIVRLTDINRNIIVLSNNDFDHFDKLVDEIAYLLTQ